MKRCHHQDEPLNDRVNGITRSRARVYVVALAILATSIIPLSTHNAAAAESDLLQTGGMSGCISDDGTNGTCVSGRGLAGARSLALSPSDENVYVASSVGVASFRRNLLSGHLSQLAGQNGCISDDGSNGICADGKAIAGAQAIAMSSLGTSVYVAASQSNAIAVFQRNIISGVLTQLPGLAGCVSDNGSSGTCQDGKALSGASDIALSPDEKFAYVTSTQANAISILQRDTTTGALSPMPGPNGCIDDGTSGICTTAKALEAAQQIELSADGKFAYVTSSAANAIAVFSRNALTGSLSQLPGLAGCVSEDGSSGVCTDGRALSGAQGIAMDGPGTHLYVSANTSDAVAIFNRDTASGQITQLVGPSGCIADDGLNGLCADGSGLDGAASVAVNPSDTVVYVGSAEGNGVAAFLRDISTGGLTQLAGPSGCVTSGGSSGVCRNGKALDGTQQVVPSNDGQSLYAAAPASSSIAVLRTGVVIPQATTTTTSSTTTIPTSTTTTPNSTTTTSQLPSDPTPLAPPLSSQTNGGYVLVARDGGVFTYGDAKYVGGTPLRRSDDHIVGIESGPTDGGYWLVSSNGGVFAYGDAKFHGAMNARQPVRIVGMTRTPSGNGYWLVGNDGGVFAFGDARFFGSLGGTTLRRPVVGIRATPSGDGYWLVASDGGVFAFGDATFHGSLAGKAPARVVGIARTPSGNGYRLATATGGIYTYGDAPFHGALNPQQVNGYITGIEQTDSGNGYWLVASDGGVFSFGDAPFLGSAGGIKLNAPMTGIRRTSY